MYAIEVRYETGSSFHNEDVMETIEYTWEDLKYAKQSLQRIKDHYEFYEKYQSLWKKPEVPFPVGVSWDNKYKTIVLELISDDGKEFGYCPSWVGYFERLYGASIVKDDSEMSFDI